MNGPRTSGRPLIAPTRTLNPSRLARGLLRWLDAFAHARRAVDLGRLAALRAALDPLRSRPPQPKE